MKNYRFKVKRNQGKTILNMRVMFKKCTKCGEILFRDKFYFDKRVPSGLTGSCKECKNSKYTHTCEQCGREYKSSEIKSRFCSKECKHKNSSIKCNCSHCGREIEVLKSKYDKCKNHFCDTKCQYEYQSGKNSPNYNPNITDEERDRNYPEYKDWRKAVYERDNYTCQCCGDNKGHNLNAHHIYGYTEYKDLRTDVDNGTTLCEECHKRYHKQYGYTNNNYKDFRTFLYNEMMKQNTLEARLFYINTIEDITLRLELRGLLELESA